MTGRCRPSWDQPPAVGALFPRESSVAQQIAHIGPGVRQGGTAVRPGGGVARPNATVVSVALARLVVKRSIREGGVNQEHVQRLMRLGGRWPPILVHETTGVVIDGVHRVTAARMLGLLRVDASLFSGGPDAALIECVRRNVQHGLPLTLRERKWAATRVLGAHPNWSDRRIAGICALSPKTVGRLRVVPGAGESAAAGQTNAAVRVGRDNRFRPVDSVSARERVAKALEEHPDASLRSVAALAGVSPETVRSVRLGLSQAGIPGCSRSADSAGGLEKPAAAAPILDVVNGDVSAAGVGAREGTLVRGLTAVFDNATAFAEFMSWFDRTDVEGHEWSRWAMRVPAAYRAEVAAEACRRGEAWLQFARMLASRADTSA
jgi:ParB-like chromosome segregation protein Spo0J